MAAEFNSIEQNAPHYDFQLKLLRQMSEALPHIPNARALDYGAGTIPTPLSPFAGLYLSREVVAFDPNVDMEQYRAVSPHWRRQTVRWTNELPVGEQFHLIGCHFSLHHLDVAVGKIVASFRQFSPQMVCIADYDFTQASQPEFEASFTTDNEIREINELFGGDLAACYEFHRRLGKEDYVRALEDNGYIVTREESGLDIARHKFMLLAEPA